MFSINTFVEKRFCLNAQLQFALVVKFVIYVLEKDSHVTFNTVHFQYTKTFSTK